MAIHTNSLTTKRIHKLLHDILHTASSEKVSWVPSFKEIAKVFINCGETTFCALFIAEKEHTSERSGVTGTCVSGANTNSLLLTEEMGLEGDIEELRKTELNNPVEEGDLGDHRSKRPRLENLKYVFQTITWSLQVRCAASEKL